MGNNSEPAPSKKKRYCLKLNGSNFKFIQKFLQVKVLLEVPCVEATSLLYMDETITSIDTRQRHLKS